MKKLIPVRRLLSVVGVTLFLATVSGLYAQSAPTYKSMSLSLDGSSVEKIVIKEYNANYTYYYPMTHVSDDTTIRLHKLYSNSTSDMNEYSTAIYVCTCLRLAEIASSEADNASFELTQPHCNTKKFKLSLKYNKQLALALYSLAQKRIATDWYPSGHSINVDDGYWDGNGIVPCTNDILDPNSFPIQQLRMQSALDPTINDWYGSSFEGRSLFYRISNNIKHISELI